MGILEMDFERILGVPFFIFVLTPSCCAGKAQLFSSLLLPCRASLYSKLGSVSLHFSLVSRVIDFSNQLSLSIFWLMFCRKLVAILGQFL
jgi:hypothetical protein